VTPLFQVFLVVVVAFLCGASLGCMRFETIGDQETPVEPEPLDPFEYCDCPACPEGETLDARIVNARCWCGCTTD
jgi:hypothetical protein